MAVILGMTNSNNLLKMLYQPIFIKKFLLQFMLLYKKLLFFFYFSLLKLIYLNFLLSKLYLSFLKISCLLNTPNNYCYEI